MPAEHDGAPANVLSDMGEPRLKCLVKQLNRSRKHTQIYRDKLRTQYTTYEKSIERDRRSLDVKYSCGSVRLKKKLAFVRGTQKCLKKKREQTFDENSEELTYGIYDGEPLTSYRRQVEEVIQDQHPKLRRQKRVETYLSNSRATGRIVDEEDTRTQFEIIMSPDRQFARREETDLCANIISPLLTMNRESPIDQPSPRCFYKHDWYSMEKEDTPTKLHLPPITAVKDFVKTQHKESLNVSFPNLNITSPSKDDGARKQHNGSNDVTFNSR